MSDLADKLEASKVIDRDLDARIAVALYRGTGHEDSRDDTHARLPSKSDEECLPGRYWISAFSGLSLRIAPVFTGDTLLKQIAITALRAQEARPEPSGDLVGVARSALRDCIVGHPFDDGSRQTVSDALCDGLNCDPNDDSAATHYEALTLVARAVITAVTPALEAKGAAQRQAEIVARLQKPK